MQINLSRLYIAGLAAFFFFSQGCTKIDSTELGADLIPAVDNVNTFEDLLTIDAFREQNVDSTKISRAEPHVLGAINNDPVFGKTRADIFLELKPTFFPYFFGSARDTIDAVSKPGTRFDSVFLCLAYTGFYGDTSKPQHLSVYQLDRATSNFTDTVAHYLNFQPNKPYLGNKIGETTVYQPDLKKLTYFGTSPRDSITNQIRIKLTPAFLATLTSGDTSANGLNNFYRNDSLFQEKFKGFAVVADGNNDANGLFYINLAAAATRLEVHYIAINANVKDTFYSNFAMATGATFNVTPSANANFIQRDTSVSEFPNNVDANALYIQSAPGSAINLHIPQLATLTNRIIHRAEIIIEQIPGTAGNNVLTPPNYLYLDIKDTSTTNRYKPLYYDLSPSEFYNPDNRTNSFFPSNGIDENYYGGFLKTKTDALGTRATYTFNLTRYVQNLVTRGGTNYNFRVYAPYNLNYYGFTLVYKNNLAFGRVKIGNGSNANYRLRMRIVWSNI